MISNSVMVPRALLDKVKRELEPGEQVKWVDMPIPRFFTPAAVGAFVFGIPWTAFAIFWTCGAAGFKIPDFSSGASLFPLFGLPFIFVGMGMLSSPIWAYRKALKTVYMITDKRALTIYGGRSTVVQSYLPEKLQDITRTEKADGSGHLMFVHHTGRDSDGDRPINLGFMNIKHPKEVEQMLKTLAEKHRPPQKNESQ